MNERERAERLAHDLDMRLSHQAYTEQTAPEDRPLLDLAGRLAPRREGSAPFAPTPTEQAQLRLRLDKLKATQRVSMRSKSYFPSAVRAIIRPALRTVLWAGLLLGVLVVAGLLVSNLLGRPAPGGPGMPGNGPTATQTGQPPTAAPTEPAASSGAKARRTATQSAAAPASTRTPRPVSLRLEQALALIQNPTWNTVLFAYQDAWRGQDGKKYSFYKQAWMDREKRGRVLSSEQVEGSGPRSAEIQPNLLFISDGSKLKALHLPSGTEESGFDHAPWRASPLENAGGGMADFFPTLSGIDQAGALALEPLEMEIAGRPAFGIRGKEVSFWYDLETGLLLRKNAPVILRKASPSARWPITWPSRRRSTTRPAWRRSALRTHSPLPCRARFQQKRLSRPSPRP